MIEERSDIRRGNAVVSSDSVRALIDAYYAQDRARAETLLADDFTFTSPQDDGIDRDDYLERCFPTADRFISHEILDLVDVGGGSVLLRYEYELASGVRYRNVEYHCVCDGRITDIEVFFGGKVSTP
jgi:hypothetical protein